MINIDCNLSVGSRTVIQNGDGNYQAYFNGNTITILNNQSYCTEISLPVLRLMLAKHGMKIVDVFK